MTKKLTFQGKPKNPFFVRINNQTKISAVDTSPTYLGSKIGLTEEINKVLKYPTQATRLGIEGPVTVAIWINADNSLGEIELVKGLMSACDDALMSAIKQIPSNWFAAKIGETAINSKLILTIDYKLDNIFENAAITVR